MKKSKKLSALLLGVSTLAMAQPAFAAIDELVVTATKREENLQTVPLAVTALTGATLERAGIEDLREITQFVAGLQFDGLAGKFLTTPVIRGLSQVSRGDDENNTSIFIDGVYVSGRDGLDSSLLDLERVEVVKGPQSALYGRNSYSGAINYITVKPGDEFEAKVTTTAGNFDKFKFQAAVGGPIIEDALSIRLSAAYDHFGGGYENGLDGSDIGGYESKLINAALRWTPTDNITVDLSSYYTEDEVDLPAQSVVPGNCDLATSPTHPVEFSPFRRYCGDIPGIDKDDPTGFTYDSRAIGQEREISRTNLTVKWDLGPVELTSISGFNKFDAQSLTDQDRQLPGTNFTALVAPGVVTLPAFVSFGNQKHEEFMQEVRLQSTGDNRLQWLAGASYYDLDRKTRGALIVDSSALPAGVTEEDVLNFWDWFDFNALPTDLFSGLPPQFAADRTTETWAVYGQTSYDFTDRLTGTVELRYTNEEKSLFDPLALTEQNDTYKFWTPRFILDFQANDDVFIYGSAARGAKAGGFNTPSPTLPPEFESYDPEFNWTYEIGAKTNLSDDLQVNIAAFYIEMDDIQITNQVPGTATFTVLNAGTGTSKGVEIEVSAAPFEGWDFNAGYALADSKFDDAADGTLRSLAPPIGTLLPSFDVSGQQLPRVSKHTFNGSVQYTHPINDSLDGYVRFDGRYESDKKGDTHDLLSSVGSHFIGNIRGGITGDNWELSAWADNVFDEDEPTMASSTLLIGDFSRLPVANLRTPRTFGVTLTLRN